MRRHRAAAYLPKQSVFVEVVEDFLHLWRCRPSDPLPDGFWHAQ
jgi:hypothetical protein